MRLGISVNGAVMGKATFAFLISFLETKSTSSLSALLKNSSGNYNFIVIKYFQNTNRMWIDKMMS